jgi:hypothetical protein
VRAVQGGANVKITSTQIKAFVAAPGTFTPTLRFGGNNTGMTGTFVGTYTRVNDRILFDITIVLTNKGSSAGNAMIGGLPGRVGRRLVFSDHPPVKYRL